MAREVPNATSVLPTSQLLPTSSLRLLKDANFPEWQDFFNFITMSSSGRSGLNTTCCPEDTMSLPGDEFGCDASLDQMDLLNSALGVFVKAMQRITNKISISSLTSFI